MVAAFRLRGTAAVAERSTRLVQQMIGLMAALPLRSTAEAAKGSTC
jgi:hypothetical protein